MGSVGSDESTAANRVSVSQLDDECGLAIDDRIERRRCEIRTPTPVSPVSTDGETFRYPVDTAVRVRTDRLTFGGSTLAFVHGPDAVTEVGHFQTATFGAGYHELEFSGPIKLYAAIEGPFRVETSLSETQVRLDEADVLEVGARSYHERPATTVTTSADPEDVMAAVSTFGSAMKTTRSERSYPTLRGHPPTLAVGDELSVPAGVDPPESNVRIEVPRSLSDVLAVSSLAYYLGCRVVPGAEPQLEIEGESFPLAVDGDLQTGAERTLKRTFLLDCIVRTAGPREIPLYERRMLDAELGFDPEDLYGRSGPKRLRAYANVPYEAVSEHLPTWKLTAGVQPSAPSLEVLPFLVNDLAVLKPASETKAEPEGPFGEVGDTDRWVHVETADSLEQVWVGPGAPVGASKALPDAYRNKLGRSPREEAIEIVVVCNDEGMIAERERVEAIYSAREEFDIDVTVYEELTAERLALVLESDVDFFHYIGHVDAEGFECADGTLDAATLETVGVDIFFLNACRSYEQGRHLIEAGAISGVVTLAEVIDSGAIRIGRTLAELLDYGFPLRSALNLARDRSIVGSQYLVIGDGNADIGPAETRSPLFADVTTTEDGYELELTTYPAAGAGIGSQFRPALQGTEDVYLSPGTLPTFHLSVESLEEYLSTSVFPMRIDESFAWSDSVELPDHRSDDYGPL